MAGLLELHWCSLGAGKVTLTEFGDLALQLCVWELSVAASPCWALPVQLRNVCFFAVTWNGFSLEQGLALMDCARAGLENHFPFL